jgi:hypothetical protein
MEALEDKLTPLTLEEAVALLDLVVMVEMDQGQLLALLPLVLAVEAVVALEVPLPLAEVAETVYIPELTEPQKRLLRNRVVEALPLVECQTEAQANMEEGLAAMILLMVLEMLALKVHSASFGPEILEHSHIWQENKEKSCLQKLKTIKWRSIR